MTRVENRYLTGGFGPVSEEVTAFDLPVVGEIPAELEGREARPTARPRGVLLAQHQRRRVRRGHLGHGYTSGVGADFAPGPTYKHDLMARTTTAHDHGPGRGTAEPAFVTRPDGTGEDDGWLISYVSDASTATSELVILDARDLSEPPLARVRLPQRVPLGFHGNWVPDDAVPPPSE